MRVFNLMDNFYDFFSAFEGMDSETSAILAFLAFYLIICGIILFVRWVFNVIAKWIFFNKCGEQGWKAIIPIYDEITLLKLSGLNWWWIFLIYASELFSVLQLMVNLLIISSSAIDYSIISLLLSLLSFPAAVTSILAKVNESNNLSKKFNKGAGHAALIFFFAPIMFLIMGLSKDYTYDKDLDVPKNGFFGNK